MLISHNGQSSSSRGPSNDDPQEKFRRQKPKEFSGTTDPLVAESWIKSMEVIFEYLQMYDLDRSRCLPAFYEIVIIRVLLAEPLGSLAFKMVQVRQLENEQKVKLEIQLLGGVVFIQGLRFPCLSCIVLS
ncbi:hypothetical protein F511_32749 [Dorcoceras hygrometricum]|uniref:Uncharacterized protein n=1 Tax=Dorcoceras hygrometricum TaxID=472368 RepID=A0A2Z7BLV5_9LAMI|nr:hypothetical protein F511_32749 [Dorcoceras hygrometricum]